MEKFKELASKIYNLINSETDKELRLEVCLTKPTEEDFFLSRISTTADYILISEVAESSVTSRDYISACISIAHKNEYLQNDIVMIDSLHLGDIKMRGIGTKIVGILRDYILTNELEKAIIISDRSDTIQKGESVWSRIMNKYPELYFEEV